MKLWFFSLAATLAWSGCASTSTSVSTQQPITRASQTASGLLGPGATPNGGLIDDSRLQQQPSDFPDLSATAWLHDPTSLASTRGRVVLVESWHRL